MATRTSVLSQHVGVEVEPLGASATSLSNVPAAAVLVAVAAGAVLGVIYSLSPLTVWFAVASVLIVRLGTRGLPVREARWIGSVLAAAIAVRAVIVAALFLLGTPDHMWFNTFFGDEQYLLVRSLRLRHLWLGSPISLEALFDVFDLYGQTSYLDVIAYVQMLVGPAPYGIHLLNAVLYVTGALVLHRLVRQAFGPVPAALTLGGTLFFPSLVIWSASGLKESLNFLVVMCVLWATIALFRARWHWRPLAVVAVVALLAALRTFRAGAFEITVTGIALGLATRFVMCRLWRAAFVTAALVAAAAVFFTAPAARERVQQLTLRVLRPAAHQHMGHVFTRGHSYKLLDQRLYDVKRADSMTWDEGLRFVKQATISVVLFPLPWDAQSRAELVYLPEQLAWYLVLILAAAGIVAGVRKDALLTSVLGGYALTALMVVALNSGNIGTLVRHRSLSLPFLIAFSAVGVTAIVSRLSAPSGAVSSAA